MPTEQDNAIKEVSVPNAKKGIRAKAVAWVRSNSLSGSGSSPPGTSHMSGSPPTSPGVMEACARRRCSLTKDNKLLANNLNSSGEIQAFMDIA